MAETSDSRGRALELWRKALAALSSHSSTTLPPRGELLLAVALLAAGIGLVSAVIHLRFGHVERALFTGFFGVLVLLSIAALRRFERPERLAHWLLGFIGLGLATSPFLDPDGIPLVLGLIVLPVVASFLTGARGGLAWTFVATSVLGIFAVTLPFEPAEQTLALNATLVAACIGSAAAWIEHTRVRALEAADAARLRAEHEAGVRRDTQVALDQSQALFSTVFRRAPSLLILADVVTRRIVDVNDAFCQLTGWPRGEAIGKTLTELDAWVSLDDRDRLIERMIAGDHLGYVDLRFRTRDGTTVNLLASAEVLEVDGEPRMLAQAIDVTERKQAQEALATYQRELEARVAESGERLEASLSRLHEQERLVAIGTLAAGIAHQINNPVGAIMAIAELELIEARERREAGEERALEASRPAMQQVLEEARRCGRIVRSVLQFARDEPTAKWIEELNPIVQRASRLAREYVERCGGALTISSSDEPLSVLVSPIEVEQSIVNLLRNAAESRRGGAHVVIELSRDAGEAVVRVSDDGAGIPEADRARVLAPFYTTRLDEGGTGLGLSVVHGVVKEHGGRIEIQPVAEGGTCIELRLPLAGASPD